MPAARRVGIGAAAMAWAWERRFCRHMIVTILRRETTRARARQRTAHPAPPTVRLLLHDIAEGIRVLQTRDGVEVSEEQIVERARNIVTGLLGNYKIRSLDGKELRVGQSPLLQMDLLDQLEQRAEARNNGRSGRA